MFKSVSTVAALALTSISTIAVSAPAPTNSFVHDGQTYNYSVEQKGNSRVIRGVVAKSGERFVLYVSDKKVSGNVNGHYVSFARSDVKSLTNEMQIAAR